MNGEDPLISSKMGNLHIPLQDHGPKWIPICLDCWSAALKSMMLRASCWDVGRNAATKSGQTCQIACENPSHLGKCCRCYSNWPAQFPALTIPRSHKGLARNSPITFSLRLHKLKVVQDVSGLQVFTLHIPYTLYRSIKKGGFLKLATRKTMGFNTKISKMI